MTIKQLESTGEIAAGIFGTAAAGAVVSIVQQGEIPHDWPGVLHILSIAGLAGVAAVFGWIKMKSPVSPQAKEAANGPDRN